MTHVSVRRGMLYVTIAATIWGTGGPAAALLYKVSGLGPVAVSFWRFVFGAALLFAAAHLPRPGTTTLPRPGTPARVAVPRARWGGLLLVGSGLAISQAAYFAAVAETGVAMATVITLGASPAVVALGARLALAERLGRVGTFSMGLALAGLVLMVGGPSAVSPAGAGLALLSAVAYAGVTLHSRASTRPADVTPRSRASARPTGRTEGDVAMGRGDAYGTAMWGFAVGGVLLLPIAAVEGLVPSGGPVTTLALLGYLGALPTALAYSLFFTGLASVRATTASMVALLEPAGATAIGVLALGERLTPASAAGAAVLLASVAFLTLGESRRAL
ncbi:DMT family transporter [Sphaerisporangium corydalis]|uniref:DMT family transporter n=1 Tax=Sphaerisporangium corydalis TaxID=1441875 RepID=A0ABV9E9T5_9ACTN|nr:DMT family transporter [Sphaerisporangium corydalis]